MTTHEQHVFSHTVGSGALAYPWWRVGDEGGINHINEVTADWWMDLYEYDPDLDVVENKVRLNHAVLIDAARQLVDDYYALGAPGGVADDCELLLDDPDAADFDADTGDQVLQVAVIGEVRYS